MYTEDSFHCDTTINEHCVRDEEGAPRGLELEQNVYRPRQERGRPPNRPPVPSTLQAHSKPNRPSRYVSPTPSNEEAQGVRNERRYRMLLRHEFDPSRETSIRQSHMSHNLTPRL